MREGSPPTTRVRAQRFLRFRSLSRPAFPDCEKLYQSDPPALMEIKEKVCQHFSALVTTCNMLVTKLLGRGSKRGSRREVGEAGKR